MSIEHYEHEHPLDTLALARARGPEDDQEESSEPLQDEVGTSK